MPHQTTWDAFLIFVMVLSETRIQAQGNSTDSPFIEPREISDIEDVFTRGQTEYVFVNRHVDYFQASMLCDGNYGGRLAFVETMELAKFLAEALSETNLLMDALWVGAKINNKTWYWYEDNNIVKPISKDILDLFVNYSQSIEGTDRKCLTMGRQNHDIPHFPYLRCSVERPMMFERDVTIGGNGSTHPGWIRLGKRLYKIFRERVTWSDAQAKCIIYDKDSRLAVIVDFPHSQSLGRYLLVGRPSLENAWIGARYYDNQYVFRQENLVLANHSNAQGYPPWRNNTTQRKYGCILLDRHLDNTTFFVEARCDRLRSFICYKRILDPVYHFADILIEEFGYRIYFAKLTWEMAKNRCSIYNESYQAKLAEIREKRIVSHLIYVMGEHKTAVQHIWLGGRFNGTVKTWIWDSDKSKIDTTLLDWLINSTYTESVEKYNTCLDMDRENHLTAIHYGTSCEFAQCFVCMFPREKLIQLQQDEAGDKI